MEKENTFSIHETADLKAQKHIEVIVTEYSPMKSPLLVAGLENYVKFIDVEKSIKGKIELSGKIYCLSTVKDDKILAGSNKSSLFQIHLAKKKILNTMKIGGESLLSLIITDNQQAILGTEDGILNIIDLEIFTNCHSMVSHKKEVTALALNSNQSILFSGANDKGPILLHDLKSFKRAGTLPSNHIDVVKKLWISNDDTYLISCSKDKTAKIFDIRNNKIELHQYSTYDQIWSLACTDDWKYCFLGTKNGLLFLEDLTLTNKPKNISEIENIANKCILSIFLENDKKTILASTHDGMITR